MIDKINSQANIQAMLQTLRSHQLQATGVSKDEAQQATSSSPASATGFSQMVGSALQEVNQAQLKSRSLQEAYDRGEDLPLTDVVIGMQKSSLAFEATLQVRNKVLKAYEQILNMPV
ncbi:MAG: Flagellar hook-basal body complex protein FliE [Pseudomonadota bacterium]|jgi:flagellar hook-basal body complex protein FliE